MRFHVPEGQVYETALALQLSNLLTRVLFAVKLGFTDLPNNVAFFRYDLAGGPDVYCVSPTS